MNRTKAVAWMVAGAGLAALLAGCGGGSNGNATIGGTVTGLAANTSVVLTDNGGNNLTVSSNGSFVFSQTVSSQGSYNVQVATEPLDQNCSVSFGSGVVSFSGDSIHNVAVACSNNAAIGAEVSGLASGNSVVLSLTLQNDPLTAYKTTVTANGTVSSFTDASNTAITLPLGSIYAVAVATQPTNPVQVCTANTGAGSTPASGGVTNSSAITVGFTCQ